jgi:predicted O-methyltransferase YrrM
LPIEQTFDDVVTPELSAGAILNQEFPGFEEDYLVLHCLMRKHQPSSIFEIGTNMGTGTRILKNACPQAEVTSLDLSPEDLHPSLLEADGKTPKVGKHCDLPYRQVWGSSLEYDFAQHAPLDAFFIDGEHDYAHVLHETRQAVASAAWLIVWHDCDIDVVWGAVIDALPMDYKLYRVAGTRIGYGLRGES